MIESEKIHQSAINADDLEQLADQKISLGDVFRNLIAHPGQIIRRYNWKSAIIGALLRASFYFGVYKASNENWIVTLGAVAVEFILRFTMSGITGALLQSFRKAEPAWLATLVAMVMFPVIGHTLEYVSHYLQESAFSSVFGVEASHSRQNAFRVSVMFSVLSAIFNLFVMRRGAFLVGAGSETRSFGADLKRVPLLVVEFAMFIPSEIYNFLRRGKYVYAVLLYLGTCLLMASAGGFYKWKMTWFRAFGGWSLVVVPALTFLASLFYQRRQRQAVETLE